MEMIEDSPYISNILTAWYHENKRDLPWRDITDPYRIWISEIILQQTRVNQGLSYYLRFVEHFPSVKELAEADEDDVLKYWQGLGYYSRARNLHKAARQVMNDFGGEFPIVHSQVMKLAGIGEYTAAAICSFAYNQPFAVVDGNVFRVLSRLFGIDTPIDTGKGKNEFAKLAAVILSQAEPGLHNQAIMEFGALQCVPVSPDCNRCQLKTNCRANEMGIVAQLPVKSLKTKVSHRFFNYLFVEYQGHTFMQKRTEKDVWQNLYEFPLIETDRLLSTKELLKDDGFKNLFIGIKDLEIIKITRPMKHVLTHRIIFAQFVTLSVSGENESLDKLIKVPFEEIDKYAVSRLMELFLETRENFERNL